MDFRFEELSMEELENINGGGNASDAAYLAAGMLPYPLNLFAGVGVLAYNLGKSYPVNWSGVRKVGYYNH